MKRSSTRNVVVSKAMKYVDEETRREFRDKRIQSLEANNYVENEVTTVDQDEAYGESDDDEGVQKKKKSRTSIKPQGIKSKWATKVVKPLERILMDNGIYHNENNEEETEPNYLTIAARPSVYPTRNQFCQVCGYIGEYTCVRCGTRFCSIKCNNNHKETRCFKFSY